MSYILDALKKAEQERRQGEIPDLKTTPLTESSSGRKHPLMFWLLIVAFIAIALLWFDPWQESLHVEKQPAQVVESVKPEPVVEQAVTLAEPVASESITPVQERLSEAVDIPNIMKLPRQIMERLPIIQISGHIYDETPSSRMVIINGYMEREGRQLSDKLMLESITADGIILNYDGTIFSMRVFDSWPR